MPPPEKLGGFKVLKEISRISLVSPQGARDFPVRVFRGLARAAINIPYAACILDGGAWGLTIAVGTGDAERAAREIEAASRDRGVLRSEAAILSIFPHRKNPEVIRSLFEALGEEGISAHALASSPSAVSVLIDESILNRASHALFGPFTFGPYRTPEDWRLAQKGKEQLYKEVVASYQEKRPKVYGLEYQDRQAFVQIRFQEGSLSALAAVFGRLAQPGLPVTFLTAGPCKEPGEEQIAFCLPLNENIAYPQALGRGMDRASFRKTAPTSAFSMNGPHFGDRYGIVSELLEALSEKRIDLLALCCTIASMTGVVPSSQLAPTIEAIQDRFDIPSVIETR